MKTKTILKCFDTIPRCIKKHFVGQGLQYEDKGNTKITRYSDVDWTGQLSDTRSTFGYCVLIGENLISWRRKTKQNIVFRSNAQAKCRAMAATTCELT